MSWEERGSGRYYYSAERVGGRVVKMYVGAGRIAKLAAELDRQKRQERETEEGEQRAIRNSLSELDSLMAPLNELADMVAAAAMLNAGYHRHHRGQWRKRRVEQNAPEDAAGRVEGG